MRHALAPAALLAVIFSGISCGGGGDGGTGPTPADPGPVSLVLTTPNTTDGAILLSVTGGTVSSVATQGYELASSTPGTGVKLLVRGALTDGPIATIIIPDRHKLASYSVTVVQIADRTTYQQRPAQGYSVQLVVP